MAAKRKASSKKDLETKIAELEAKLSKLSSQLEAPKPAEVTQQAPPPQQSSSSSNTGKSKQQALEEYEAEYLNKMAKEQKEYEELMSAAAELKAKRQAEPQPSSSQSKKGSLPKGF